MRTQSDAITERVSVIRENIRLAAQAAGRDPDSVTLMGVTKTMPPELVNSAVAAGVTLLGENRVQEFLSRREKYCGNSCIHFIGHLQTNKVQYIIDKVQMIHSVDSVRLGETISRHAAAIGIRMPVLLEVNVSRQPQKFGFLPEQLPDAIEQLEALPGIKLRGLMCIPAPGESEEGFSLLQHLFQKAAERMQDPTAWTELSMGMSGDYKQAIAHGATIIRIGSELFGQRI